MPTLVEIGSREEATNDEKFTTDERRETKTDTFEHVSIGHLIDTGDLKIQLKHHYPLNFELFM